MPFVHFQPNHFSSIYLYYTIGPAKNNRFLPLYFFFYVCYDFYKNEQKGLRYVKRNRIAVFLLSGTVVKLTRESFDGEGKQ